MSVPYLLICEEHGIAFESIYDAAQHEDRFAEGYYILSQEDLD